MKFDRMGNHMKNGLSRKLRKLRLPKKTTQARLNEKEDRKKYEEFWSDSCWTEPLSQNAG
jgi:hypothetical protein